jgi:hypothetical protein
MVLLTQVCETDKYILAKSREQLVACVETFSKNLVNESAAAALRKRSLATYA